MFTIFNLLILVVLLTRMLSNMKVEKEEIQKHNLVILFG